MKITRNGQEFELDRYELAAAYLEYQHMIDIKFADMALSINCTYDKYAELPEKERKALVEDMATQMRELVCKKRIHEEEAMERVIEEYIAKKVSEEKGRRISKGKRKGNVV